MQRPLVQFAEFLSSNDVRNQDKDDFIFLMLCIGLRKQILQNRNLGQSRNPAQRFDILILQKSTQQIYFAFLQPDFMLDLSLSDYWLVDAANVDPRRH